MDKYNVLITINKVHDRFGGVAARKGEKNIDYYGYKHFSQYIIHMVILL